MSRLLVVVAVVVTTHAWPCAQAAPLLEDELCSAHLCDGVDPKADQRGTALLMECAKALQRPKPDVAAAQRCHAQAVAALAAEACCQPHTTQTELVIQAIAQAWQALGDMAVRAKLPTLERDARVHEIAVWEAALRMAKRYLAESNPTEHVEERLAALKWQGRIDRGELVLPAWVARCQARLALLHAENIQAWPALKRLALVVRPLKDESGGPGTVVALEDMTAPISIKYARPDAVGNGEPTGWITENAPTRDGDTVYRPEDGAPNGAVRELHRGYDRGKAAIMGMYGASQLRRAAALEKRAQAALDACAALP